MNKDLQDAILEQLQPLQTSHGVRIGALDAQELGRPTVAGQVFVLHKDSRWGEPKFLDLTIVQEEQVEIEILCQFLNLRTHDQASPLLQAIRGLLTGFAPLENQLRPLVPQRYRFIPDRELLAEGIWLFSQTFVTTLISDS